MTLPFLGSMSASGFEHSWYFLFLLVVIGFGALYVVVQVLRGKRMLRFANTLRQADELLAPRVTPELIADIVGMIPDAWLHDSTVAAQRQDYARYLEARIASPRAFAEEALRVR